MAAVRRHPLHQDELAYTHEPRHCEHRLEKRVRRDVQQRAAAAQQPRNGERPAPAGLTVRPAGYRGGVRDVLGPARSVAEQEPEVDDVQRKEHHGIDPAQALLEEDHAEVQERRHEPHDLERVLPLEPDRREEGRSMLRRSSRPRATGDREHEVDHRPPEAEQQADGAGEVRDRQVGPFGLPSGVPRDHGFDGELGQRLQPGQHREGEALGDQELGGFRTPGDEEGRRENGGKRPQRGQRGTSRRGQQSEYL